jgi:protein dithiol:quinone oxidoreductase
MIARLIYLFALLASVLLLGLGMYIQYSMHLQSCGPQVLVRYALMLAGLFALGALIIGTGKIVRIAMSAGIALISLAGALVAAHQSWPHRVPLSSATVGVNIDSLARSLPLADVMPKFFAGAGECDRAHWTLVGIAGSEWALIAFVVFIIAGAVAARGK